MTTDPLLRSNQALNKQASRILKLFGKKTSLPIISYSGLEQEFFLIDRNFVFGRPDLLTAGRTLFGAKPAKGQEFEDQYYGVMPRRVMSCITEPSANSTSSAFRSAPITKWLRASTRSPRCSKRPTSPSTTTSS